MSSGAKPKVSAARKFLTPPVKRTASKRAVKQRRASAGLQSMLSEDAYDIHAGIDSAEESESEDDSDCASGDTGARANSATVELDVDVTGDQSLDVDVEMSYVQSESQQLVVSGAGAVPTLALSVDGQETGDVSAEQVAAHNVVAVEIDAGQESDELSVVGDDNAVVQEKAVSDKMEVEEEEEEEEEVTASDKMELDEEEEEVVAEEEEEDVAAEEEEDVAAAEEEEDVAAAAEEEVVAAEEDVEDSAESSDGVGDGAQLSNAGDSIGALPDDRINVDVEHPLRTATAKAV